MANAGIAQQPNDNGHVMLAKLASQLDRIEGRLPVCPAMLSAAHSAVAAGIDEVTEVRQITDPAKRAQSAWLLMNRLRTALGELQLVHRQAVDEALAQGQQLFDHHRGSQGDELAKPAQAVLKWITRTKIRRFSVREAHRRLSRARFPTVDDVQVALDFLEMEGYIHHDRRPQATGGRPASPTYTVV